MSENRLFCEFTRPGKTFQSVIHGGSHLPSARAELLPRSLSHCPELASSCGKPRSGDPAGPGAKLTVEAPLKLTVKSCEMSLFFMAMIYDLHMTIYDIFCIIIYKYKSKCNYTYSYQYIYIYILYV